jgi:hypothetical protein
VTVDWLYRLRATQSATGRAGVGLYWGMNTSMILSGHCADINIALDRHRRLSTLLSGGLLLRGGRESGPHASWIREKSETCTIQENLVAWPPRRMQRTSERDSI